MNKLNLRFTLRQLQYFVAAGETGSITRAAAQVNISQPSISAAISHLESELGVHLFVRHHAQGLSLTPAGKLLMHAAKRSLDSAFELYDVANMATESISGPLNVGVFDTLAPLILPEVWKGFVEHHPNVTVRVTEGSEATLLDYLRTARIDVALTYDINLTDEMAFLPLASLPPYVLLAADHPLASRASLSLLDLKDEPFILLDLPLSRQHFLSFFERENLSPNILAETSNPATLRSYVGMGFGYSLLSARPLNTKAENDRPLAYVRLEGGYRSVVIGLATLEGLPSTRIVDVFKSYCEEIISTLNIPGMTVLPQEADSPA